MKKYTLLILALAVLAWGQAADANLEPIILQHDDSVVDIAFSPDGTRLATASRDTTAKLWDGQTGEPIATMKHSGDVNTVVFSPDGMRIATASDDNTAQLWDGNTGELIAIMEHDDDVHDVIFSPDGTRIATASDDNKAQLWDGQTGEPIATMKHSGDVNTVVFSPDGMRIATASDDNTAQLWDGNTGELIAIMEHDDDVHDVTFSPDGKRIATISGRTYSGGRLSQRGEAKLWDGQTGRIIATMKHSEDVYAVTFSPDGTRIATGSGYTKKLDRTTKIGVGIAKLWDGRTGEHIVTKECGGDVLDVAFSPDGIRIAAGCTGGIATLWNVQTGNLIATMKHPRDYPHVSTVIFSPGGTILATKYGYSGWGVKSRWGASLWDGQTGDYITLLTRGRAVYDIIFNPNRTGLATASDDNTAKLWLPNIANVPALIAPADDAKLPDKPLTLEWEAVPNVLRYQVQVAKDEQFKSIFIDEQVKKEEMSLSNFSKQNFWRVRTVGVSLDSVGKWSDVWSFSISLPSPPTLSEPADGTAFADTLTPALKWQESQGATSYGVQIAMDEKFTEIIVEQEKLTTTEFTVPGGKLFPGKYFWRVNTAGVTGISDWTKPRWFTVDAPNIIRAPVLNVTRTDFDFEMKGERNITVEIKIDKAQNLYGFQFDLQFAPNVLEAIKVTEGDFLKSIGGNTSFLKPSIDNRAGVIKSVVASRMSPGEVSGSGTLAEVEFNFKKAGTSPITFPLIKLSDEQFQSIDYAYVDGSVTLNITKTTPSAKIKVQPGIVDNQVVAKILIEDAVNLRGYSVDLEYPSALELLDVSQGDFLTEGWQQTTPNANTVRFSGNKAAGESVEGSGEIATLTFRIWEEGEQAFVLHGTLTAPVVTDIYTPELQGSAITVVASPNWEVNKDYVVDMQDIVILGIDFDKNIEGNPRPNPDVTRDGLVDLFDLVAVASHYPDEYSAVPQPPAAPTGKLTVCSTPTPTERAILQDLYNRVARYPDTDDSVLAVKRLLASLISGAEPTLPQRTRLAQNYPNPFNPETWIPFELAEAADVTIKIYDAKGQLVRTLALGQQPAGFYLTQERAAYWDGRNASGEQVASGVYFYTLTAGKFTATKKFIMLK